MIGHPLFQWGSSELVIGYLCASIEIFPAVTIDTISAFAAVDAAVETFPSLTGTVEIVKCH
jgi:hypothetical protein